MHEVYAAFSEKDFSICCLKVNFLSIAIPSSKTSLRASTLIEFLIYDCDKTYPQES